MNNLSKKRTSYLISSNGYLYISVSRNIICNVILQQQIVTFKVSSNAIFLFQTARTTWTSSTTASSPRRNGNHGRPSPTTRSSNSRRGFFTKNTWAPRTGTRSRPAWGWRTPRWSRGSKTGGPSWNATWRSWRRTWRTRRYWPPTRASWRTSRTWGSWRRSRWSARTTVPRTWWWRRRNSCELALEDFVRSWCCLGWVEMNGEVRGKEDASIG